MAKAKSFADKLAKKTQDFTTHCQTCGESLQAVKLVYAEKSDKSGDYRFKQRFVGMCKCNENELQA